VYIPPVAGPKGGKVRVDLCGDVRLEVAGRRRERELPGRLGRALLAYLTLHRQRPVGRSELVHALWRGGTESDRAATLSTLLSALRRTLSPELVQGRSELRLALPADAEVDVERAAVELERARAALDAGDHQTLRTTAEAALDVLELPLLPEFDAEWLDDRRAELEEDRLDALELLAKGALAGGRETLARAKAAARRLVALAPYRESGYELLMEAHAAHGNVAEALQVFERLRQLMRDELGTTPSAELRAAHEGLLARTEAERVAGDPAAAQQSASRAAGPLPMPVPLAKAGRRPFVGREEALAHLREWLQAAAGDERRFAFLAGEPGIGKTSLAATFARQARDSGATVLYGRSDEDTLIPYQPFVDMISHCVVYGGIDELGDELRFELEEIGRLVPELRRHLPVLREPLGGLPETERYRLFEAVITTLARVARGTPLVLIFDDLHWADPPTLRLLRHLARASEPSRLLVVGTYRDVELEPGSPLALLLADVRREEAVERVSLGGLDAAEAGALISTRRGDALPGWAAERLREMTAGNPFFLEETLRVLGESAAEGVAPELALEQLGVPEGVREVLLQRITRLGDGALELLTLAAAAGDPFRPGVLEPAPGRSSEATELLERAVAARLLVEAEEYGSLSFSHALIRNTLYARLSEERRARLHQQIAERLETHRALLRPGPAELARHYFEAREVVGPEKAVRYARDAAQKAARSLAWEQAELQLERALEADAMRDPRDHGERCELLLELGEARLRSGHAAAREAFAEAAELARRRSPHQLARAAIGYGGRYYELGVIDQALIALLRDALAALGDESDDLRARVLARLAEILHFAGDAAAALELAANAVDLARRLGDDEVLAATLAGRHVSLLHISHLGERVLVSSELLEVARRIGDAEREMQARHARIYDLLELGDLPAVRAEVDALATLAGELRQPLFLHFVVGWRCVLAQIEGRLDEAERLATQSFEMRRRLETHDADSVYAVQIFMIRRAQGRLFELLPAVVELVERFPWLDAWLAGLPVAYLAGGEEDRAREELTRMRERLHSIPHDFYWLTAMSLLAEAAVGLDEAEPAAELYELLAPYADRSVQSAYVGSSGPVARLLGLLAGTTGDRDAAVAHLEHALERSSATGAVIFELRSSAELAELLATSEDADDRRRASGLVADAVSRARELGIEPVVQGLERHVA
jgi:DNA-binding SARP family transcriptional activator